MDFAPFEETVSAFTDGSFKAIAPPMRAPVPWMNVRRRISLLMFTSSFFWAPTTAGEPSSATGNDAEAIERHARGSGRGERLNKTEAKGEDGYGGCDRKQKRPGVDASKARRVKIQAEAVDVYGFVKNRVDREPDREIEDYANDGGGYRGECA